MPGEPREGEKLPELQPAAPSSVNSSDSSPALLTSSDAVDTADNSPRETAQATLTRESASSTTNTNTTAAPQAPQAAQGTSDLGASAAARPPRPARQMRRSLFTLAGIALIVLALTLLLINIGRLGGGTGTVQHPPTATPRPTATATVIPTPTAMPGFKVFIDTNDGFMLQYPVGWVEHLNNPGAEFADDATNPTFEMQVLLPSDSAAAGLTGDPNDPSSWVEFAMQSFATQYAGKFQEDAGPLPAAQFAGATWQTARGLISDQVRIRVQVYATVYQGKPYIISLYASDDAFSVADMVYFHPMRTSFQFLPPTP